MGDVTGEPLEEGGDGYDITGEPLEEGGDGYDITGEPLEEGGDGYDITGEPLDEGGDGYDITGEDECTRPLVPNLSGTAEENGRTQESEAWGWDNRAPANTKQRNRYIMYTVL